MRVEKQTPLSKLVCIFARALVCQHPIHVGCAIHCCVVAQGVELEVSEYVLFQLERQDDRQVAQEQDKETGGNESREGPQGRGERARLVPPSKAHLN
jgi:hypothetical protein